jgi:hypothetical protein
MLWWVRLYGAAASELWWVRHLPILLSRATSEARVTEYIHTCCHSCIFLIITHCREADGVQRVLIVENLTDCLGGHTVTQSQQEQWSRGARSPLLMLTTTVNTIEHP